MIQEGVRVGALSIVESEGRKEYLATVTEPSWIL